MKAPYLVLMSVLFAGSVFAANPQSPPQTGDCLKCHSRDIAPAAYFGSVHKNVTCLGCHIEQKQKTGASKGCIADFTKTDCTSCHSQIVKEYESSIHNSKRLPMSCAKCHDEIHSITSHKNDKLAIAKQCGRCHSDEKAYFESSHHQALQEGRTDAATCTDCHGVHTVAKVDNQAEGRLFHTQACLKCHADEKLMAKNKVTTIAARTYFESFHGKNVRLGYPERVAGCADCHGSHGILKAKSPESTIYPSNRAKTCAQCHSGATPSFAQYLAHADHHDRKEHPSLFWTFVAMNALLAGTFLFFWIHSMLWAIRSFIENRTRPAAHATLAGGKRYRRFRQIHIYLHLIVVVSFLGLALTGLPLKFSATPWGKGLMDCLGGTARAGLIHRTCAVITFLYFGIALVMSVRFLRRNSLFGPDSLFPNLRDFQDVRAMFRWFFFRGPKPSFERWTYWEKFDFLAVFWGMLAIGSSGLMLWFPTFFARFLPGWMFNIATIVHSDEALLATGFIFTVHFFNTHFRPEKFPMDFVIFNGEVTHEEMRTERADQWRRYEAEGRTEEFVVEKSSSALWDFCLKAFGFAALVIGIGLAVVVAYTLLSHP